MTRTNALRGGFPAPMAVSMREIQWNPQRLEALERKVSGRPNSGRSQSDSHLRGGSSSHDNNDRVGQTDVPSETIEIGSIYSVHKH